MIRTITLAAGLALAACAYAQHSAHDPAPDTARADAPVPPTTYVSPLAGYRAAPATSGTPAANWAASNAAVAGGGHGMHGKHAAPQAHAGNATAPAADPHSQHKQSKQQEQPKQPGKEHHHEH